MPISNKLIASSLLSVNEDKLPIPIVAFTGNPILPSLSLSGSILFSEQYEIFVEYTAGSVAPEVGVRRLFLMAIYLMILLKRP